ncbi:MAG: hypothetical protein DDT22_00258 [candidate division WS2 bacterium]|nr:hypothetical protein [Candidatus Lithacetigena glycinireducens]MBT9174598.1 hypothetical protein [Candidatus Lithacetigena glycinireducens]
MDVKIITDLVSGWSLLLIPLILALTSLIKKFIPEKKVGLWSPIVSLVLGVCGGLLTIGVTKDGIIAGLIIGLTASGLYSGGKNIINQKK